MTGTAQTSKAQADGWPYGMSGDRQSELRVEKRENRVSRQVRTAVPTSVKMKPVSMGGVETSLEAAKGMRRLQRPFRSASTTKSGDGWEPHVFDRRECVLSTDLQRVFC